MSLINAVKFYSMFNGSFICLDLFKYGSGKIIYEDERCVEKYKKDLIRDLVILNTGEFLGGMFLIWGVGMRTVVNIIIGKTGI